MTDRPPLPIGATAKKRFGQNFLTDQNIIGNIIRAIHPRPDDALVEIGPGHGALTFALLETINNLHVIEIDRDLIRELQLSSAYSQHRFTLHEGDALKVDLDQLATTITGSPTQRIRLIGNLPYNISTPLLFHLGHSIDRLQDAHFMLQKEVVERMGAAPNSKTYGRLTVMIQALFRVEPLFTVPPTAFDPPPKVQSQIVRLTPHANPLSDRPPADSFPLLVRTAFSARRKTLRKGLKGLINETGFAACDIDPGARPENLSVKQYIDLSHHTLH